MLSAKQLSQLKNKFSQSGNQAPALFDALGDANRFKIFMMLLEAKQNICVSEFADICDISVPAASQQLKSLEQSGLIKKTRAGQTICYQVKQEDSLVKLLAKMTVSVAEAVANRQKKVTKNY